MINLPPYFNDLKERIALFVAFARGQTGLAKLLLEMGAVIGNIDLALRIACENRHEAVARLLLERGASVYTTDRQGKTLLLLAIEKAKEEYQASGVRAIISVLVEHGADINAVD